MDILIRKTDEDEAINHKDLYGAENYGFNNGPEAGIITENDQSSKTKYRSKTNRFYENFNRTPNSVPSFQRYLVCGFSIPWNVVRELGMKK